MQSLAPPSKPSSKQNAAPVVAPAAVAPEQTLACGVTPRGHIVLRAVPSIATPPLPAEVTQRIEAAFAKGRGYGVLHLGAAELGTALDPSLSFWRDLGESFVVAVCSALRAVSDPASSSSSSSSSPSPSPSSAPEPAPIPAPAPHAVVAPQPDTAALAALALAAPPMQGAELITPGLLAAIWSDMGEALAVEAASHRDGVQGYLQARHSVWNVLGRVCFHLAENKRDPDYPFAFIATYAHRIGSHEKLQHVPLRRALQEYAGAKNRKKLLTLLAPLSRAAERSAFLRTLVDSGDIYHPLSWSPKEAYRFLCEVPLYEQSGVVVRVPDWWSSKNRPRPKVTITVGGEAPSHLGVDALLDFDMALTLDGKPLSKREIETLLAATDGLAFIKGQWVEIDREKLTAVLDHWRDVQAQVQTGGISFAVAMRMLSGAALPSDGKNAPVEATPEWSDVVAGKWLSERLEALRSPQVRRAIEAGAGLRAQLRPYQQLGVEWLWTLRQLGLGGCLADDMGLGKTIQVLAVLALAQREHKHIPGTDLLVVPASLIDNWRLEIERFAPQLRVLIAHPSCIASPRLSELPKAEVDAHDAVITTYGTVTRVAWMRERPWRSVIVDEAQALKNPSAKQTRALKALNARWRLALTGTPVENKLGDLWSIFDFINPGLLGSAKAFNQFCKQMAARSHNAYTPLRKLVQPYILRRLKTDKRVIADLPDKIEVSAFCLLSKHQAVLYRKSVDEMRRTLETVDGMARRGVVLAFLMRFKQICNHPSQWLGDHRFEPAHSGKFSRLRELCEPMAARQDKVLVFTQFRELTDPLAAFLADVFERPGLVLHGGTPVKKRQGLVRAFQEDEDIPFMVLSLKAGGTGLNLTAASHVIHFDRWWNPAVENQATDRAFRIGQKRNVMVHKFVCRGTLEERIDTLIAGKQQLSEAILSGDPEAALTELSNEELLQLVSLDLQSAVDATAVDVS